MVSYASSSSMTLLFALACNPKPLIFEEPLVFPSDKLTPEMAIVSEGVQLAISREETSDEPRATKGAVLLLEEREVTSEGSREHSLVKTHFLL